MSEFESWWSRNGGDLESQRSKAFTLVCSGGLELILVAPDESTKRAWVSACTALLGNARFAALCTKTMLGVYSASGKKRHDR